MSPAGEVFTFFVEVACNGMFGVGNGGMIRPPNPHRTFSIAQAELAVWDPVGSALLADLTVLYDLARHMPDRYCGQLSACVVHGEGGGWSCLSVSLLTRQRPAGVLGVTPWS